MERGLGLRMLLVTLVLVATVVMLATPPALALLVLLGVVR